MGQKAQYCKSNTDRPIMELLFPKVGTDSFYKNCELRLEKCLQNVHLLHDNAQSLKSTTLVNCLMSDKVSILPHPYSPNLAPFDLFLFPKLKTEQCGNRMPTCELNSFCVLTTTESNLGRRFGTGKMHLSPQGFMLLFVLKRWFCCC